ncbi:venom allergen 5.02-like [Penaeus japonicus]|uniref:venom allergen 5.02-like n=1 Tax=Penaeus japonicus TaxID=27405 RepID=UPI001C70DA85|nr:venom allergen 5.02-like [Penaeus japonicus]
MSGAQCDFMLGTGGITCKDIETILSTHNTLRQKVSMGQVRNQPPALNMRVLEWDDELAAVAQRWADQCMPGHDRSRNVPRFTVGQNVAAAWTFDRDLGDTPDFATQVEAWFNEVNQYGFPKGNVDPFRFNKATGHYTQVGGMAREIGLMVIVRRMMVVVDWLYRYLLL